MEFATNLLTGIPNCSGVMSLNKHYTNAAAHNYAIVFSSTYLIHNLI